MSPAGSPLERMRSEIFSAIMITEALRLAVTIRVNWRFHKLLYAPCYLERLLSLIERNYGQAGLFIRAQAGRNACRPIPTACTGARDVL